MKTHETLPLLPIQSAQGVWLVDTEGNRYFDAISSWWVTLFGHSYPPIVDAISEQAATLDHVLLAGCTHEPAILLAEKLIELAPKCPPESRKLSHCLFSSDGSSAVESAIKLAVHFWKNRGFPQKNRLIKLAGSYHGETVGAMSVMDIPLYRSAYETLIFSTDTLPVPDDRYASDEAVSQQNIENCLKKAEQLLAQGQHSYAALIVEPLIQCANHMTFYDPAFLKGLRQLCDRYQILLIADEIAVGMGRTGSLFACEQAQIVPDMMCLSKGLTGGFLPLSVTLTTDELYDAFYGDSLSEAFLHSHSYTGNPIACRAALTTLECLERNDQIVINQSTAEQLTKALTPLIQLPQVKNFRHRGMIWAFEVASDHPNFSQHCAQEGLKQGLLIRPLGHTVYLMPPYQMNPANITFLADRLTDTVRSIIT